MSDPADATGDPATRTAAPAVGPPGGPTAPPHGLAAKVTRGATWSFIALGINQVAIIGSQVVLGYKLKTEFALYMVAIAALSAIGIIRDVGLRKILVVRGGEYAALARPVFLIALGINILCALVLVAIAPLLARYAFETYQPALVPMMWVIAASVIVSTFGVVQSAKLTIDFRFKALAAQVAVSGILRQTVQLVLALAGFGAMSFVWPMLFTAMFDAITMRWLAGAVPRGGKLSADLVGQLFKLSKWVVVALLGMMLTYRADGFIVAQFEDLDTVVTYYGWAIALTVQALQPFTTVLYATVLPAFATITSDSDRTRQAYLRVIDLVSFLAAPAVLGMCLASPLGIHLIWQGRWDNAIAAVALILVATPFKSLQACALAFDESHSRFRRSAFLLIADGITALAAVTIGVAVGGLVAIATAILIQRAIYNTFHTIYVGRSAGIPLSVMLSRIVPPLLLPGVIGVLCSVVPSTMYGAGSTRSYWAMGLLALPATLLVVGLSWVFMRERFNSALDVARSRGR